MSDQDKNSVSEVRYFKFSPSTTRYKRVMELAQKKDCDWQDIVRNALDFYLEFQEKKTTILTLS